MIDNKPYAAKPGTQHAAAWDEVRSAVGATFGDVVSLGEMNILVEGVVDQVLLAGASCGCEGSQPLLDLSRTSIVPFQHDRELERLLHASAEEQRRAVVVVDSDQGGDDHAQVAGKFGVPVIRVRDCQGGAREIEDLVAESTYVEAVNQHYEESRLEWFSPIRVEAVAEALTSSSITDRIDDLFSTSFPHDGDEPRKLDKAGVAIRLAQRIDEGTVAQEDVSGLTALLGRCRQALDQAPPVMRAPRRRERVSQGARAAARH